MTSAEILALITFLDELFSLGGKLVEAALQKAPELIVTPLPDLSEMDKAKADAEARVLHSASAVPTPADPSKP